MAMPDPIPGDDPLETLRTWIQAARDAGDTLPERVALATVDGEGRPSVRMVLARGIDPQGVCFYTNYNSKKAADLEADPRAALCFYWRLLRLQVRVEGHVERLPPEASDAYFASRPRESQLGAWASPQSEEIDSRATLEAAYAEVEARFAGSEVPRPPHWGGYRLVAERVELWAEAPYRLHDRLVFERGNEGWGVTRLAP